jgi:hypothetical protein
MDFRHNRLDVSYYEGTSLVTLRQPGAAQPVLDAALAAQDLLGQLEPWRGRPAVEELRERVVASWPSAW